MVVKDVPSNRLRELRERSRLTVGEVAKLMDLTTGAVSRHETGHRSLDDATAARYARIYKVLTHEIFVDLRSGEERERERERENGRGRVVVRTPVP